MKKILLLSAICVVFIESCQKQETGFSYGEREAIRVMTEYPDTRATSSGFKNGDTIGLYAVEYEGGVPGPLQIAANYLNNEKLEYDGAAWKSERMLYWSDKACDFYAYYPYMKLNSVDEYIFNVALDQSVPRTEEGISAYEASDLLWAKATDVSYSDGEVRLKFKHLMSKIVVKIIKGEKFEGELPEDIVVHIYNTVTSAKVDFSAGTLEKYLYGTKNTITAKRVGSDTFEAILVPQNLERRTSLVELTMGGIAYMLDYSMSFLPGHQHVVQLIVNTSPDQEKIEISIDGSIEDW